jgi:hypothetical protein
MSEVHHQVRCPYDDPGESCSASQLRAGPWSDLVQIAGMRWLPNLESDPPRQRTPNEPKDYLNQDEPVTETPAQSGEGGKGRFRNIDNGRLAM